MKTIIDYNHSLHFCLFLRMLSGWLFAWPEVELQGEEAESRSDREDAESDPHGPRSAQNY